MHGLLLVTNRMTAWASLTSRRC